MGRRLLTKAPRVDETGAILVNYAADRIGGVQASRGDVPSQVCVPFSSASLLPDRKYLILAFPSDGVFFGSGTISTASSYWSPGTDRGSDGTHAPAVGSYSNRKQFLRGQYWSVPLLSGIGICANNLSAEYVAALELS